jgi:type VI secretion system protein ImpA
MKDVETMPDIAPLLQPIGEAQPSGPNLRLHAGDLTFGQLEELRRESDPVLDPGGEAKSADWRGVVKLCDKALREKTKDLELAAAYTQGLLYTEGWPGLQAGLQLLTGLVEQFWETVHPGWDEGEIIPAIRARPLSWLGSGQDFLLAAKRVPLTAPIGDEPRSWFDYEQSRRVDEAAAKANRAAFQELIEAGLITGEQWRSSLAGTPLDRLDTAIADLGACRAALQGLQAVCEDRYGEDAPYLLDLRNLLDDAHDYLVKYKAGQIDADGPEAGVGAAATVDTAAPGAGGGPAAAAGPIKSRDEAFRRLREVADFLRRTEPHSPVSALLERAVRWGNMTFEDLFRDVVHSDDARGEVGKILGLKLFEEEE